MLENILIDYFDLQENYNWNNSYNKLINLLYDLEKLGVLNANTITDKLDKIVNEREISKYE